MTRKSKKPTKKEIWVVDQMLYDALIGFDPELNCEPIIVDREVEDLLERMSFEDAACTALLKQEFYRSKPGFEDLIKDWAEVKRIIRERWEKRDNDVGSEGEGDAIPPTTH